ncbi:PepSY domain-containing protein [Herbidospora yilanensis]|uniref:PepSY domain-containing protein n=1 Tax=Herbidospora yilanensis TaxID=354426 RepID=UPI0007811C12|nr:PepSY domain-containing protein [Herbidospora yilanensis]
MRRKTAIATGVLAAALAAGVTGAGIASADSDDGTETPDRAPARPTVLVDAAQRTAVGQVPGGWVVSSELEGPTWEIEVADSDGTVKEVYVDAAKGTVVQAPADEADEADEADDANDADD